MLPSFMNKKIRVTVPGTYEERGTVYADLDNPADEFTVFGCFNPGPSAEDIARGDHVRVAGVFYVRPGRPIPPGSRLKYRGTEYRLIGAPEFWESPTGAVTHQKAVVEVWE